MSALDYYRQIATGSGGVSPAAHAWLAAGLSQYRFCRGALSLDRCLGLPGPAHLSMALRNVYLLQAAAATKGKYDWPHAVALLAEIRTFRTRHWPQWRNKLVPPIGASELRSNLFLAFRESCNAAGIDKVPDSEGGIYKIIRVAAPLTNSLMKVSGDRAMMEASEPTDEGVTQPCETKSC